MPSGRPGASTGIRKMPRASSLAEARRYELPWRSSAASRSARQPAPVRWRSLTVSGRMRNRPSLNRDQTWPAMFSRSANCCSGQPAFAPVSAAPMRRLAANFHRRGVTLAQIERAIWLGCARKYVALLNGQTPMLITSLHYFTGLVDEVMATSVADSYWLHVQRTAEQL